jgi:hypothetical protein
MASNSKYHEQMNQFLLFPFQIDENGFHQSMKMDFIRIVAPPPPLLRIPPGNPSLFTSAIRV